MKNYRNWLIVLGLACAGLLMGWHSYELRGDMKQHDIKVTEMNKEIEEIDKALKASEGRPTWVDRKIKEIAKEHGVVVAPNPDLPIDHSIKY